MNYHSSKDQKTIPFNILNVTITLEAMLELFDDLFLANGTLALHRVVTSLGNNCMHSYEGITEIPEAKHFVK